MGRLLIVLLVLPGLAVAQPKEKGTKHAFIVAVSKYDEVVTGLRPLPFTVKDVEGFREALLATGYEAKNIRMLHDELPAERNPGLRFVPKQKEIMSELGGLLNFLDPADSVVVVLNGHGVHFDKSDTSHFCPLDANLEKKTGLIPMDGKDGLYPMLEKCKARSKLLIAGMCRNNPKEFRSNNQASFKVDLSAPEKPPKGIAAFYSCETGQMTYYDPEKGSYFFKHLTAAWKGEYAGDEELTLDSVFASVRARTKNDVFEMSGGSKEQFPEVRRRYDGTWNIPKAVLPKDPTPGEPRDFEIFKGVRMRFCWIPAGEARLGSSAAERQAVLKQLTDANIVKDGKEPEWLAAESEEVRGKFKTKGFWLGKYEVTQREWEAVMGANKNPSKSKGPTNPVENVSWDDCRQFIDKCGVRGMIVRLPHENEWEYACRGDQGDQRAFYWGEVLYADKANCDGTYPFGTIVKGVRKGKPTPAGSYEKAAPHPWHLCDMHGNVWEWCDNLHTAAGPGHVMRGGSWNISARFCRSASRGVREPTGRDGDLGFRLALIP